MAELSKAQRDILLQPIKEHRVKRDQGGYSYLDGFEVLAHLNRIFGFEGWSTQITMLDQVFETQGNPTDPSKKGWYVCYRCSVRLIAAGVTHEDAGSGDAQNQPSRADAHDLAIKSAVTSATKRAATGFGDQFGLSLYKKGSVEALVGRVIPYENESFTNP